MATAQPIRDKEQARAFIAFYREQGQVRNWLLVTLAVHTALRISDILRLTTDDVYDFARRCPRRSITLTEKKTGKGKTVALHASITAALMAYYPQAEPRRALIPNPHTGKAISRVQAYRIFRAAADMLRFSQRVGCHALRKTFGYHAWKTGVAVSVIMDIFNHSSYNVTRRYLGICQDDCDAVYLGMTLER